jgi:trimeric autotransporter adhesin
VDSVGPLYFVDPFTPRVRKVTASTGDISTVAGDGTEGYSGDGGHATRAELNNPTSVGVDGAGNLYIEDAGNGRIRKVAAQQR